MFRQVSTEVFMYAVMCVRAGPFRTLILSTGDPLFLENVSPEMKNIFGGNLALGVSFRKGDWLSSAGRQRQ